LTAPPPPPIQTPATWTLTWKAGRAEAAPAVEICPLKYGKRWAYAVEIDDGPVSTLTVSQPLLAACTFTDAPPGVPGGKTLPFVGGAAVIGARTGTANASFLNWDQVRRLQKNGWGLLSHSYRHSGYGWDAKGALTPDQFRDELYWSQTIFAAESGTGRAPIHLVLPNGYTAYAPYLAAFGLRSASRVGGKPTPLRNTTADFADMDRNYLDESVWSRTADALAGLPATPAPGSLIIDFTHGMEADPASANHKRWKERLGSLSGRWGRHGDDSVWCAPTSEVVAYTLAARAAAITSRPGRVTLRVPTTLPGTALRLHLRGVPPNAPLSTPPGGSLYRRGAEVWITTPRIGLPGAPAPRPHLRRVYRGPAENITLAAPARIAGIRILQQGKPKDGFTLGLSLVSPTGKTLPLFPGDPGTAWGTWLLYPIVPNRAAVTAKAIRLNADPSLSQMEVWAVLETGEPQERAVRRQAATPNSDPTAAERSRASAPQNVTRAADLNNPDPPTDAATAPRTARNTSAVIDTTHAR
jgi:hypothetical protein